MKFLKKISLFIALAVMVTIGGVYAGWLYPSDDAAVGSATKTFTGNMAQVDTQATSKGNISVDTANDTLKFFVEDAGSYLAQATAQGSFTVIFTPAAGVSESISSNGIDLVMEISITGTQTKISDDQDHEVSIFTVKTATLDLGKGTKDGNVFKRVVTGTEVLNCLTFCGGAGHTVHLETLVENKAFGEAMNTYTINLKIKEKTTVANS